MNETLLSRTNRMQRAGLGAGVVALALCGVGAFFNPRQFFISYLFAYLFWIGLSLGCLCVAMIHHLTGGRWGDVTRRFLEAGYMTLPLMTTLFLPILAGLRHLYPWARSVQVAHNEILRHKEHYQNVPGFVARAVIFFLIWIVMAVLLRKWSRQQDHTLDLTPTRRARALSGPGVVIYAVTVTFASVDWLMALEPDWYSTLFPVIICSGQILSAFAFAIILLARFRDQPPFLAVVDAGQFHQLGNLLLTFVMFWTYVCFGQLLIIWSGNLPHEIVWYLHRIAGNWKWIASFLALFNFFLPFFLLLFRRSKKNAASLRFLAGIVFICQIVNSYWTVEPSFFQTGIHVHWLDFAATIGIGGLWIAMFAVCLKRAALLTETILASHTLLPMPNDDVNFKGILGFLGVLAVSLAGFYLAVTVMWRGLEKKARLRDEQILREGPSPAAAATRPYFPLPREQPVPVADLQALRAVEEAELNSYGWVDKTSGVVRIPIDRAIDLMSRQRKEQP